MYKFTGVKSVVFFNLNELCLTLVKKHFNFCFYFVFYRVTNLLATCFFIYSIPFHIEEYCLFFVSLNLKVELRARIQEFRQIRVV